MSNPVVHSLEYHLTRVEPRQVITHNFIRSDLAQKQWLAEIKGICPKWGYKREFVKGKTSKAVNFMLKKITYELKPFKVYQYKGFLIDDESKKFYDGFFAVTALGVIELEQEQIRVVLNMPVKSWYHKREVKPQPSKGKYASEDLPF